MRCAEIFAAQDRTGWLKITDMKLTDQMTGHEIAEHEIAGHERSGKRLRRLNTLSRFSIDPLYSLLLLRFDTELLLWLR